MDRRLPRDEDGLAPDRGLSVPVRPRQLKPAIAPGTRSGRFEERRIFVDAPPDAVWRALVDPDRGPGLVPEAGLGVPSTASWPAAGSQRPARHRIGLLSESGRATSVEARPGTTFWLRVETPSLRTDWTWRMEPVSGGTRVIHVAAISARGRLTALLVRLGRRDLGAIVEAHLAAISDHVRATGRRAGDHDSASAA